MNYFDGMEAIINRFIGIHLYDDDYLTKLKFVELYPKIVNNEEVKVPFTFEDIEEAYDEKLVNYAILLIIAACK